MAVRTIRARRRSAFGGLAAAGVAVAGLLVACGPAAAPPRPTDPHLIVTEAVKATAAIPTLRLHLQLASTADGAAFGQAGTFTTSMAIDADVDLAGRQLAGRATSQFSATGTDLPGPAGPQTSDIIATSTALFTRQGGAARWTMAGSSGLQGGPSNAAIASAIVGLLDDPRVTYDKADPVACTLGTCDHVIVHLPAAALTAAISALTNAPANAMDAAGIPDLDLDVRIAQTSSVISEIRLSMTVAGQTADLLLTVANPGDPVQIVAPAPGLIDDNTGGFGGGTILETVGSEVQTPSPAEPQPSTP
jgi:hypothetical protein